jgi:hypothetical protein
VNGSIRVATSDGSKKVEDSVLDGTSDTDATVRRGRTAAEQRAGRSSGSDDPETIVSEIERTREDLAETLDAIADKVSPKRVASRTKRKVSEAVKDGATEASATVKEKAASASEAARSGAASSRRPPSTSGDRAGQGLGARLGHDDHGGTHTRRARRRLRRRVGPRLGLEPAAPTSRRCRR